MARCATGAGRRSGALSRGDRDASLSLSLAAYDSQRAITTRALRAPVDASSVASGRRRNETEPGAVGKANRAPLSRSLRTFCRREAPRRGAARGARRRSCARARTCWRATEAASHARGRARRCGAASRARKRFPLEARIESARAFYVARSLGSHKLPRSGIFWRFGAQRLLLRRFVTRHEHPTRGKHRLVFNYFNASQSPIVARRRTNERTNDTSVTHTQSHHLHKPLIKIIT